VILVIFTSAGAVPAKRTDKKTGKTKYLHFMANLSAWKKLDPDPQPPV
jgi:hypothetical protein